MELFLDCTVRIVPPDCFRPFSRLSLNQAVHLGATSMMISLVQSHLQVTAGLLTMLVAAVILFP